MDDNEELKDKFFRYIIDDILITLEINRLFYIPWYKRLYYRIRFGPNWMMK